MSGERQQQILECLAHLLEAPQAERVTTSALAQACGLSEAALYRHFPSKASMYAALIGFAVESVFSRVNRIMEEEKFTPQRCVKLLYLVLSFADKNPGITRLLLGEVLIGENDSLREQSAHFFRRLETQLKQILREASLRGDIPPKLPAESAANLLLIWVEGRLHQFVRSNFQLSPLEDWEAQWQSLAKGIFLECLDY